MIYVSASDNAYPHTVVEDQPIDAIGFHPAFWDGTAYVEHFTTSFAWQLYCTG